MGNIKRRMGWVLSLAYLGTANAAGGEPAKNQHTFEGADFGQQGELVAAPRLEDLHERQRKELQELQMIQARRKDSINQRTRGLASIEERLKIVNEVYDECALESQELRARHAAETCSQFKVGCPEVKIINLKSSGPVSRDR